MHIYVGMLPPPDIGPAVTGITPVNFLAETLDSRVSYQGPEHYYWNASGVLALAAVDEWPIEYQDGEAVGRHLPEKAATNLLPSTNFDSLTSTSAASQDWVIAPGTTWTVQDSGLGVKEVIGASDATKTMVYNNNRAAAEAAALEQGSPTSWTLVKRIFTNQLASALRWYPARYSATQYLYGLSASADAVDLVASCLRKVDASGVHTALPTLEAGSVVTSPIVNGVGESRSRTASSVVVTEPSAGSAVLRYNDGTTESLSPVDGVFTLPVSVADWGSRWVTSLTFGE